MLKHFTEVEIIEDEKTVVKTVEVSQPSSSFVSITQGPAEIADEESLKKDKRGITHPNLHRRIETDKVVGEEVSPREYKLAIHGVDSYRLTRTFVHDEESTTSELP